MGFDDGDKIIDQAVAECHEDIFQNSKLMFNSQSINASDQEHTASNDYDGKN